MSDLGLNHPQCVQSRLGERYNRLCLQESVKHVMFECFGDAFQPVVLEIWSKIVGFMNTEMCHPISIYHVMLSGKHLNALYTVFP